MKSSLDLDWPTLHKKSTCAMLAHGKQTTFMGKINYIMLVYQVTKMKLKAKYHGSKK